MQLGKYERNVIHSGSTEGTSGCKAYFDQPVTCNSKPEACKASWCYVDERCAIDKEKCAAAGGQPGGEPAVSCQFREVYIPSSGVYDHLPAQYKDKVFCSYDHRSRNVVENTDSGELQVRYSYETCGDRNKWIDIAEVESRDLSVLTFAEAPWALEPIDVPHGLKATSRDLAGVVGPAIGFWFDILNDFPGMNVTAKTMSDLSPQALDAYPKSLPSAATFDLEIGNIDAIVGPLWVLPHRMLHVRNL